MICMGFVLTYLRDGYRGRRGSAFDHDTCIDDHRVDFGLLRWHRWAITIDRVLIVSRVTRRPHSLLPFRAPLHG